MRDFTASRRKTLMLNSADIDQGRAWASKAIDVANARKTRREATMKKMMVAVAVIMFMTTFIQEASAETCSFWYAVCRGRGGDTTIASRNVMLVYSTVAGLKLTAQLIVASPHIDKGCTTPASVAGMVGIEGGVSLRGDQPRIA